MRMTPAPLVLVIDDDVDVRTTVAGILRDEGYRVAQAGDGSEALGYLTGGGQPRPALILLDMRMPVMDGAAFRQQQQRHPDLADIPIVTFTAFGTPADINWAVGQLTKPLRLDALLELVARHATGPLA